jgi:hypothetical protein
MKKKGQAAMEFLMTYGWAILVVLAAIGALAYFGVLSPKNILPSSCTVGAGFGCKDTKATAESVQLTLLNNLGNDLDYINIQFTGDVVDKECDIIFDTGAADDPAWNGWYNDDPNNLGEDGTCDADNCSIVYDVSATSPAQAPLRTGKAFPPIILDNCNGPDDDEVLSGNAVSDFTMTYKATGETLTHQVQGKANLKVEQ